MFSNSRLTMKNWLRGLWLLRHPELIRDLGERRFHLQLIEQIRRDSPHTRISSDIVLTNYAPDRLQVGIGSGLSTGTALAFGDDSDGYGRIEIGERTWIGQYNNLRAGGGVITIGDDCLISQFCSLIASNHAIAKGQPIRDQGCDRDKVNVTLGDDIWLGAGATIMPGVTIDTGAVVGANSVVTKSIPEYEIWAGSPAKKIGER